MNNLIAAEKLINEPTRISNWEAQHDLISKLRQAINELGYYKVYNTLSDLDCLGLAQYVSELYVAEYDKPMNTKKSLISQLIN